MIHVQSLILDAREHSWRAAGSAGWELATLLITVEWCRSLSWSNNRHHSCDRLESQQHETEAARYQMSLSYLNLISLSCTLINWSEVPINDKLVFSSDYTVCLGSSPSRHLLRIPQSGTTSNVMTLRLIWQELVHGWDLSPFEVPISMPPSHSRVTCLALENL